MVERNRFDFFLPYYLAIIVVYQILLYVLLLYKNRDLIWTNLQYIYYYYLYSYSYEYIYRISITYMECR